MDIVIYQHKYLLSSCPKTCDQERTEFKKFDELSLENQSLDELITNATKEAKLDSIKYQTRTVEISQRFHVIYSLFFVMSSGEIRHIDFGWYYTRIRDQEKLYNQLKHIDDRFHLEIDFDGFWKLTNEVYALNRKIDYTKPIVFLITIIVGLGLWYAISSAGFDRLVQWIFAVTVVLLVALVNVFQFSILAKFWKARIDRAGSTMRK